MIVNVLPETEIDVLEEIEQEIKEGNSHKLIIFNDDYNTFDHVIDTLIDICQHSREQAEQCAIITHYVGKCSVKEGSFNKLRPLCEGILDRGINAEVC